MPDQPNTAPVAYGDGKGNLNLHCLTCPRPPEATTALSVNDIDHWDQCRACRRYVVDVAREAAADRPHACAWPTCLTPDQHTELAAQVTTEEHGEHRPAMPDQRAACGCSEAACHCGLGTRAQCATKAWGCGPGSTDPNTEPAPAPVDPEPATGPTWAALAEIIATLPPATAPYPDRDLRQRVAAALLTRIKQAVVPAPDRLWPGQIGSLLAATEYDLADTVLAELAPELAALRTRAEQAEAARESAATSNAILLAGVTRVLQMVSAWEEQLPDTIRTATAVDAIRTALGTPTPAEEPGPAGGAGRGTQRTPP